MELAWDINPEMFWLAINSVSSGVHFAVIVVGGISGILLGHFFRYDMQDYSAGFITAWTWVASICVLILTMIIPATYPKVGEGLDSFPIELIFNLVMFYVFIAVVWFLVSLSLTWILRVIYVSSKRLFKKLDDLAHSDE